MESNSTLEINYTFFSGNLGPGPVSYDLSSWENQTISFDQPIHLSIEPSKFLVEPNQKYKSKVRLITGKSPFHPYGIRIEATLHDRPLVFASDYIWIYQTPPPGISGLAGDRIDINNTPLSIRPGEMRIINLTFIPGRTGIGEVAFLGSASPLNVTVIPGVFLAKYGEGYLLKILVTADQTLKPGNYSFSETIKHPTPYTIANASDSSRPIYFYPVQSYRVTFEVAVLPVDNIPPIRGTTCILA
jgi:hypothetical protein